MTLLTEKIQIKRKRDLKSLLEKTISGLVAMGLDVAKLDVTDNDQASRRLKRDIKAFKEGPLKVFTEAVYKTREEIRTK